MFTKIRKYLQSNKAQTTAEYAILIGLVVGAVVVMQVYIKRGFQAKVKDGTDLITAQTGNIGTSTQSITLGTTGQYEPYYLSREQQQILTRDKTEQIVNRTGAEVRSGRTSEQKSVVSYGYDNTDGVYEEGMNPAEEGNTGGIDTNIKPE